MVIIPEYEILHRDFKYNESIDEIYNFFKEFIFKPLPENKKRKYFLSRLYGTQISEALYIIYYLNRSLSLRGEVCEYGCANGATSALIANEILGTKKELWLYDSFEGLSKPTNKDKLINDIFRLKSMRKYKGAMKYSAIDVYMRVDKSKFPKKRLNIIPGFIDKTIKKIPDKVCFAYIDFDLYSPIKIALDGLHRVVVKGGYIIIDDYDYFSSGVKTAVTEFLNENKGEYKLILPKRFAGHFCILEKLV